MDKAMTLDGKVFNAIEAHKGQRYICICCGSDVVLAQGKVRKYHFKHNKEGSARDYCKYYVSQFGSNHFSGETSNDEEVKTRSGLRLELIKNNQNWELFLRFPVIKSEIHALVDRHSMYLNIRYIEEDYEFNSIQLLGYNGAYRIPIKIRESYTIEVDKPQIEKKMNIHISGRYQPFKRKPLLFKHIQGSLLHIPYTNVMLSGRFVILSPTKLSIHPQVSIYSEAEIGSYTLYECHMPGEYTEDLLYWFARVLGIQILPSKCYIDLIYPATFRMFQGLVEVTAKNVILHLTHNDPRPKMNYIRVIEPSGNMKLLRQKEPTIHLNLEQEGVYSIYPLNNSGEILEICRVSAITRRTDNVLSLIINNESLLFRKPYISEKNVYLTSNFSADIYTFNGDYYKINRPEQHYFEHVKRIHIPYIWSFRFTPEDTGSIDRLQLCLYRLIKNRDKYRETYIGIDRFVNITRIISKGTFTYKKQLIHMLNMKRGFLPSNAMNIIRGMERLN